MGKYRALMIFLAFSLFLVFQNLKVVNAVGCAGSFFDGNSSFGQNIFSTLADKVVANGGFYNASLGQSPNRVHALALCARGYEKQACISCVEKATQGIQSNCQNRMDLFTWDKDDEDKVSCLVSSSNQSNFGNLELRPAVRYQSPLSIESSTNMTLFEQEWNAMVNRTTEAASEAENSLVLKYYSAKKAEFTEFPNVYMLMQCTPDLTSQDCKNAWENARSFLKICFGEDKEVRLIVRAVFSCGIFMISMVLLIMQQEFLRLLDLRLRKMRVL